MSTYFFLSLTLPTLLTLHSAPALSSSCSDTTSNPTCGHVKAFSSLCCPWPNLCYYKDSSGTPGCCPAGETCLSYENGSEVEVGGSSETETTTTEAVEQSTTAVEESTVTVEPEATTTTEEPTTQVVVYTTTTPNEEWSTTTSYWTPTTSASYYSVETETSPGQVTVYSTAIVETIVTAGSVITVTGTSVVYPQETTTTTAAGAGETVGGLVVANEGVKNGKEWAEKGLWFAWLLVFYFLAC